MNLTPFDLRLKKKGRFNVFKMIKLCNDPFFSVIHGNMIKIFNTHVVLSCDKFFYFEDFFSLKNMTLETILIFIKISGVFKMTMTQNIFDEVRPMGCKEEIIHNEICYEIHKYNLNIVVNWTLVKRYIEKRKNNDFFGKNGLEEYKNRFSFIA